MRNIIAVALLLVIGSQVLWGQNTHLDKIRSQVGRSLADKRALSVETADHRKLKGVVTQAGEDDFTLDNDGTPVTLRYDEVAKAKLPMTKGQRSVLVGAGILGGLFGLIAAAAANDR